MKTISRIAYSNDKRNRTRSILIMMAICLTTMLLVIISTVGNGVIHLQKSQAAGSYGSNYGLFVSADGSQLKEVNRRAEIDATGTMCTEGIIKGNEKGGFVCMDETARKMLPYNKEYELKEGKYPEKMQEIAAGRAFFRAMGYGHHCRLPIPEPVQTDLLFPPESSHPDLHCPSGSAFSLLPGCSHKSHHAQTDHEQYPGNVHLLLL